MCLQNNVTVVQKTTLDSRPGKKEKTMSQNQPKEETKIQNQHEWNFQLRIPLKVKTKSTWLLIVTFQSYNCSLEAFLIHLHNCREIGANFPQTCFYMYFVCCEVLGTPEWIVRNLRAFSGMAGWWWGLVVAGIHDPRRRRLVRVSVIIRHRVRIHSLNSA